MAEPGYDVVARTQAYEAWLAERIEIIASGLTEKHAEMARSPVRFLRGSYYVWLERFCDLAPSLLDVPVVPVVGDLHVENFGTWRDHAGHRRWGVNDYDEAGRGAYTGDLVRLASSASLAPHVSLEASEICDVLLDVWLDVRPGRAAELEDPSSRHLAALLPGGRPDTERFYAGLTALTSVPPSSVPSGVREAVDRTIEGGGWTPSWHARQAGTGSLGHPRYEAVGTAADGHQHAREVKLLGPSSSSWLRTVRPTLPLGLPDVDATVFALAMQELPGPDPCGRVDGWQYRRLSPDDVRIELARLDPKSSRRLLRSMAQAVVDVHGLDGAALLRARTDAHARDPGWLAEAVTTMTNDMRDLYHQFRRSYG